MILFIIENPSKNLQVFLFCSRLILMATETVLPHDQTSITDEQVEKKLREDVKTVDQDIVSSSSKESGEEKSKLENPPSVPDTNAKSAGTDEKPTQPSVVEDEKKISDVPCVEEHCVSSSKESVEEEKTKAEDSLTHAQPSTESPTSDVQSADKIEESKTTVVLEPVTEVKKSQAGDDVKPKEEHNEVAEKGQEELPKAVDVPKPLGEAVEKPKEISENPVVQESESEVVKEVEESEAVPAQVEEQEPEVPKEEETPGESIKTSEVKEKDSEAVPKENVEVETAKNEESLVDKVETSVSLSEEKTEKDEQPVEVKSSEEVLVDQKLHDFVEKAAADEKKKDLNESDVVEKIPKEAGLEIGKVVEEYAEKNVEVKENTKNNVVTEDLTPLVKEETVTVTEDVAIGEEKKDSSEADAVEKIQKEAEPVIEDGKEYTEKNVETEEAKVEKVTEDSAEVAKVEGVNTLTSTDEVIDKPSQVAERDIVLANENKTQEQVKDETLASVETHKEEHVEGERDQVTTAVNESLEESKLAESEVKEKETEADKSREEIVPAVIEPVEEANQLESEVKEKETEKTDADKSKDEVVPAVYEPVEESKQPEAEIKAKETETTEAIIAVHETIEESKQPEPEVKEKETENTDTNKSQDKVVSSVDEALEESQKAEPQVKETEQTDPLKLGKEEVAEPKSKEGETTTVHEQVEEFKLLETEVKEKETEKAEEEVTTAAREVAVEESQKKTESEVKEHAKEETETNELEKEKVEDIEKSDKKLETLLKDGDETKPSKDLPKEVQTKPAQKQSNNIISKVKNSLVKAKKAIIGKSPSKTPASEAKDDIKVK
ncbi:uncharacterized abhydrolase domain-containing protein DDB_G0269086 isoform X2 [Morus notabilis]|uniref:uncharacterized abhydrolase domain-containing protein DDB_G0269086 isoform X2 n=1 Tax=Morus notabilis TaxID=981085 RepID=UPI000CED6B42|nr:uncharacterized abhydrolase domain-containing protein DDB_G0269086 isoform X2 [Morus notabilis]